MQADMSHEAALRGLEERRKLALAMGGAEKPAKRKKQGDEQVHPRALRRGCGLRRSPMQTWGSRRPGAC